MSLIPTDLAPHILCFLPVKTLLRFKCVAKTWGSLIDDPDFAKLHLDHSLEINTNVKLVLDNRKKADDKAYSVDFDSLNNLVQIHRPFTAEFSRYCSRIFGSCNGLLAVYHRFKGIALWNPSTRKCRYLPPLDDADICPPPICYDYDSSCNDFVDDDYDSSCNDFVDDDYDSSCNDFVDDDYEYSTTVLGFGFDINTNDYKVAKMLESLTQKCYIVMLYSLKANAWRRINDVPYPITFQDEDGVYINNSLHWGIGSSKSIFALNLGTEKYYEVPLPEDPKEEHQYNAGVLGGCLCVSRQYCLSRFECHAKLWVMEEYGNKGSWTELLYVDLDCEPRTNYICFTKALAYSRNRNKILLDDDAGFFHDYHAEPPHPAWFNLVNRTGENLSIPGAPQSFTTTVYVESLVSVD